MGKIMMRVLEALDAGEEPSALSLQIHVRSREQHATYLDSLTPLLGQGVACRREVDGAVYQWREWNQGSIVLHEPCKGEM